MTPNMLRQIWSLIETTQSHILLKLDDASLVQWLLKQLKNEGSFNNNEADILREYLHSKVTLIRDMAQQRQSPWLESH